MLVSIGKVQNIFLILLLTKIGKYDTLVLYLGRTKDST
jgi:hypothetical protein